MVCAFLARCYRPGVSWHYGRAASGAPRRYKSLAAIRVTDWHWRAGVASAGMIWAAGGDQGAAGLGLAAFIRTSARPENAVRVRYLFDNCLLMWNLTLAAARIGCARFAGN
jgi:hypothetical protein